MVLLNLGLTTAINNHRPETQAYVSTPYSKNNSKRQTFTVRRQLVPDKFPFPQNRFAVIASALASLENFNEVEDLFWQ